MQQVWIMGEKEDAEAIAVQAADLQRAFAFADRPSPGSVPVRLVDSPYGMLYTVDPEAGVMVNTARAEGVFRYTGLPRRMYLLAVSLLGILQYRAMQQNPEFREEDFIHRDNRWCLYSHPVPIEDAPLYFERPRVCHACWQFYLQVCPMAEVQAVRLVLENSARAAATLATPNAS